MMLSLFQIGCRSTSAPLEKGLASPVFGPGINKGKKLNTWPWATRNEEQQLLNPNESHSIKSARLDHGKICFFPMLRGTCGMLLRFLARVSPFGTH
ncbi:hypothetical protein ASC97_29505 [Rhizobium sp. Root1203]|nr:hypothetical protein ASC97_29505 [Rhizobium sp. Root1203]